MGMYTAFHIGAELKKDVPEKVIEILQYMHNPKNYEEVPKDLPDHEFFKCERWRVLFRMDSYYFSADTHSQFRFDDIAGAYFLTVTSNLKNYDDEIGKFMDWIDPYLGKAKGDFLGYSRYEEFEEPSLIYKK